MAYGRPVSPMAKQALQHQVARPVYDDRQQDHSQGEVQQRVDQSLWFFVETEYKIDVGTSSPSYPVFINEAAYYYKGLAFIHCIKEGLEVPKFNSSDR